MTYHPRLSPQQEQRVVGLLRKETLRKVVSQLVGVSTHQIDRIKQKHRIHPKRDRAQHLTVSVRITMSSGMHEKLKTAAALDGKSLSTYVRMLIREDFENDQ